MQRKLIGLSTSTTVISLPSSWIKQQELKKGDSVLLEEIDGSIIINPINEGKQEINIDTSKTEGNLTWYLIDSAYSSGYDKINIITKNNEQTRLIGKIVRYFPGMIIEKESKNLVIIQDISSIKEVDAKKLFTRIFHMIGALLEEFLELSKNKDWKELKNLKKRDYTINSYFSLFLRYIAKKGYSTFRKSGETHTYLKLMELFSDRLCELANLISEDKQYNKKQEELLQDIAKMYRELEKQHFRKDKDLIKLDNLRINTERKIRGSVAHKYQFSDLVSLLGELEQVELMQNM